MRATLLRALAPVVPSPPALRDSSRRALARRARSRRPCLELLIFSPGGERQQVAESGVHADAVHTVRKWPDAGVLAQQGHMPASGRILRHGHGGRLRARREATRPHHVRRLRHPRRRRLPVPKRNTLVAHSADLPDFLRDLKRGYWARSAKKRVNAVRRRRRACWSGTEETSSRWASSPVFFHAAGIAGVALLVDPLLPQRPGLRARREKRGRRPSARTRTGATARLPAHQWDGSGT